MEAVYADENVWLSQKVMAQLHDVEVPTINYHLKKVFEDSELEDEEQEAVTLLRDHGPPSNSPAPAGHAPPFNSAWPPPCHRRGS